MSIGIINIDPEILGGTPVFMGTRVPIKALFDYLKSGETLDDFLEGFPSVSREQARRLLDLTDEFLLSIALIDREKPAFA